MFRKETEYALRSLIYIQVQNYKKKTPGIVEIASEIDTPKPFTAKILQRLVAHSFIESIKGKNGGFLFDEKKADLTLKEVIYSIEGEDSYIRCGLGLSTCDETCQCPLHESFSEIREATDKLISEETIQGLAMKKASTAELVLNRIK